MKKCLPAALVALLVLTAGCFSNSDVELVKNGSFAGYPSTTVGKILDSNFEKIKWSSSQTAIGETVVRFDGRISPNLHAKMDVALSQLLLMMVNHGILAPDTTKEKLTQMLAAFHRLPQTLGEANRVDFEKYQHIKTGLLPRAIDCQKLSAATGVNVSPEWNAQAEECIKIFESVVRDSIKAYFWTPGSQVFIEWKISNNKKSFALSQFGGDGLPNLTFNDFLKAITSD